ncbi:class I SAM-dependent methyltransferase [Metasolibacillus meyeri]|uniref:Class I SAM-dependent methyltransferase n=1 Tax=Metasolibacillus meyeri TaxID=1071052 RepID=A0AAW9NSF9_9BACL|nr:class I SAM-dependent methyltransferase [Metasolibacillus meyeri]MEC1180602.1 class I SAM-dependent methyltransferase [Metasolibacillus meyeri]
MSRSTEGLKAAGEWHILKGLLPTFENKSVLDLGCGYGWHCRYAIEQGASAVIGIDISAKMLKQARALTNSDAITYLQMPIEDIDFAKGQFDMVISSLAFHYIEAFDAVCEKIFDVLTKGGSFVFSVEHPIFTSRAAQDWHYGEGGERLHWAVDDYHSEGLRQTTFLGEDVVKYHRTVASYLNTLIGVGFTIKAVQESYPSEDMLEDMKDELRRPMFLQIAVEK